MVESDLRYGFIFCPNQECNVKVGIFSLDGQKCQTCLAMVAPAFQWFRSRLTQYRYGDGGNGLNLASLNQLNGLTSGDQFQIRLGAMPPKREEPRLRTSTSNQSLKSVLEGENRMSESQNGRNRDKRTFQSGHRVTTAGA